MVSTVLPDLKKLEKIVIDASDEILIPAFGKIAYEYKDDGSVVTEADHGMQQALIERLREHWPEYQVLGEEMTESEQDDIIASEGGYWCIDPLDGTNNFATGLHFFAVSIALIQDDEQVLGLIYDPIRREVFTAIRGQGAFLNSESLGHYKKEPPERTIAEIDMKRLPDALASRLVTEPIYGSQRNIGSSALDWCWLAAGRYNIYLHGGQKLWDYSAGNLILHEAGGRSISLDGDPVFRGRNEIRSALASLDVELFEYWLQWVDETIKS